MTDTITPATHRAILWPHRLVFNFSYGRWVSAGLVFTVMYTLFYILGNIGGTTGVAVPLFFCLVFAYIIPASHFINDQSVIAFDSLRPILDLDDEEQQQIRISLLKIPVRTQFLMLTIGLFAGLLHDFSLLTTVGEALGDNLARMNIRDYAIMLATILIWVLLTTTISFLIHSANIFARLAKNHTNIDLLNISSLSGFARLAVYSTLLLVGALAGFPILILEAGTSYLTIVPGLLAISIPMLFIFLIPLLPIRKRIKNQKRLELDAIQHEIKQLTSNVKNLPADGEKLVVLQPLLDYRREIKQVPEWPFDSTAMFRLIFYLIIPPLTWVGAALIERLVDAVSF